MPASPATRWLAVAFLVLLTPTLGCVGFYAVSDLGLASVFRIAMTVPVYPLALLGLVVALMAGRAPPRWRRRLWLAAGCLWVPEVVSRVLQVMYV